MKYDPELAAKMRKAQRPSPWWAWPVIMLACTAGLAVFALLFMLVLDLIESIFN